MYKNLSFHKFFAKKDYLLIIFLHLQDLDTKYLNVIYLACGSFMHMYPQFNFKLRFLR